MAALFNAVLDVEARAGPSESHISRAKSSIFTCICLQCDISTSIWARRVGPTRQGPGCPLQGIGLANMIVCPMTLQYRMASWTDRQSGTMEVGKTPTTENLPRIADLGAPSSTHGVLVMPATRAQTSGTSWAPTCKFHHPSRNRKPRVSIRFIHASLPGSRVRPCTVIVRDTPKASLHHFGWVSRPHAKRGGCNHIGTATAKWCAHTGAKPKLVQVLTRCPT